MKFTFTLLCENSVGKATTALAEHGFSCLIETPDGKYLFDTGQGYTLGHNLGVLDKDLEGLKGVFLSHGHYDHTGGLPAVLSRTGGVDVFAHPGIFQERYWAGKAEQRSIGIPISRESLMALGARFRWMPDYTEAAPGLFFTGSVPRITVFEQGDDSLVIRAPEEGKFAPDPFADDASLLLMSHSGPVLLMGCAHAGLVNILHHVRNKAGIESLFAVIGGTHLAPAGDEQFEKTVEALQEFKVQKIMVGHCTGQKRAADLYRHFGKRFLFAAVGSVLEV